MRLVNPKGERIFKRPLCGYLGLMLWFGIMATVWLLEPLLEWLMAPGDLFDRD